MNFFKILFLASRPKTLSIAISPIVIAISMAYKDGFFNLLNAFIVFISSICLQIIVNISNDYFDFQKGVDNEERLGPVRVVQSGFFVPEKVKTVFIIVLFLTILFGFYLVYIGGISILIIGLLALTSAILYTGGPCPYGYLGFAECIIFLFFGPISTYFSYYILSGFFVFKSFFAGCTSGFLAVALYVITSFRDVKQDKKYKKKTLAVRFGYKFSFLLFFFSICFAFIIPIFFIYYGSSLLLIISSLMLLYMFSFLKLFRKKIDVIEINYSISLLGKFFIYFSFSFSFLWLV